MKFQVKLIKTEKMYRMEVSNPTIICYGRTIKEVFTNLKKAFVKLEELNQLEDFRENVGKKD